MKTIFCLLLVCFAFDILSSQDEKASITKFTVDAVQRDEEPSYTCSAKFSREEKMTFRELRNQYYEEGMALKNRRATTVLNVTAHRTMVPPCIPTQGGQAPIIAEIEDDINYTNEWFAAIGFNVYLNLAEVNDICDSYWHNDVDYTDPANWTAIYNEFGVDGHLNIFYLNSGSAAYLPNQGTAPQNMFVHKNTHAGWGWTVAHEGGHWFGLTHTFNDDDTDPKEGVTRDPNDSCFNCDTEADGFCSTDSDYGTHWCDSSDDHCTCTGDYGDPDCNNASGSVDPYYQDDCGVYMTPDLYNIMAYGCRPCAHVWTGEQVDALWVGLAIRLLQPEIVHASCNYANLDQVTPAVATTGQRVEANGYIISTQNIETSQYTLYDGSTSVDLNPGFTCEYVNGAQPNFEVVNEGCYGVYQMTRPGGSGEIEIYKPETIINAPVKRD